MRATTDKLGRLVIPKALRERLGLRRGSVEVATDGAVLREAGAKVGALHQKFTESIKSDSTFTAARDAVALAKTKRDDAQKALRNAQSKQQDAQTKADTAAADARAAEEYEKSHPVGVGDGGAGHGRRVRVRVK